MFRVKDRDLTIEQLNALVGTLVNIETNTDGTLEHFDVATTFSAESHVGIVQSVKMNPERRAHESFIKIRRADGETDAFCMDGNTWCTIFISTVEEP